MTSQHPSPSTAFRRAPGRPAVDRSARPGVLRGRVVTAVMATGLAAGLVLGGCSSSSSDGAANGAQPSATEREAAVEIDAGDPGRVALLTPGAEPRRVLAYAASRSEVPRVAVSSSARVSTSTTAGTPTPGGPTPTPGVPNVSETPEQTLVASGEVAPDVDGAQRVTTTVREFTSTDPQRSAQFATGVGFELGWLRDADGAVRSLSYSAPAGATDAARAAVEVLSHELVDAAVRLPREPVGVGARWTVTRPVADAVAPTRVVTFELTALDGELATVRVETTAPEVSRTLEAPAQGAAPAVALDVRSYEVTGTGTVTVDLRGALPVDGTVRSTTKAVYADPRTGAQTASERAGALGFRRA